jgi:hypothetical protein
MQRRAAATKSGVTSANAIAPETRRALGGIWTFDVRDKILMERERQKRAAADATVRREVFDVAAGEEEDDMISAPSQGDDGRVHTSSTVRSRSARATTVSDISPAHRASASLDDATIAAESGAGVGQTVSSYAEALAAYEARAAVAEAQRAAGGVDAHRRAAWLEWQAGQREKGAAQRTLRKAGRVEGYKRMHHTLTGGRLLARPLAAVTAIDAEAAVEREVAAERLRNRTSSARGYDSAPAGRGAIGGAEASPTKSLSTSPRRTTLSSGGRSPLLQSYINSGSPSDDPAHKDDEFAERREGRRRETALAAMDAADADLDGIYALAPARPVDVSSHQTMRERWNGGTLGRVQTS